MTSKEQIDKQLHDLGWDYNENLRCYSNENRYVELADAPYIDIYTWYDGNKDASYLTIEEFILFSKLFKEESYEKDLEILELLKQHSGIVEIYSVISKEGEHFVCEINDKQDVEKLKGWLKDDK